MENARQSERPPPRLAARAAAHEARQEAYRLIVLEAAGRSFAQVGVAATKMEELARQAGISLATLYSVYRGKAEIVDALHEHRLREIHAASLAARQAESNPLAALLAGSRAYITYFIEHPDYLRLYIDEGSNWGVRDSIDTGTRRAEAWSEGVAQFSTIFKQGIEASVFAVGDPDQLARVMLAMQQVQLADWLHSKKAADPEVLVASVETLLMRAFCICPSCGRESNTPVERGSSQSLHEPVVGEHGSRAGI
jgi:AcrR family transcriptional regulator